jgi:Replication-relaxation
MPGVFAARSGLGIVMRYPKGTFIVSRTRDIPLLEYVLRCGFATRKQLFEFLQMDGLERSLIAFRQRMQRLEKLGLICRQSGVLHGHEWIYSIAPKGASLLLEMGELCDGRGIDQQRNGQLVVNHWLDLNEIHLALRRRNVLVRWTPESEVRSQNQLTTFRYAKDYDAIVTVRSAGLECRFALEYERLAKSKSRYTQICNELDQEIHLNTLLYLAPSYHVLSCIKQCFAPRRLIICLAVAGDFVQSLLDTPVIVTAGADGPVRFADVIQGGAPDARDSWSTPRRRVGDPLSFLGSSE